jgi:hypothetical protein
MAAADHVVQEMHQPGQRCQPSSFMPFLYAFLSVHSATSDVLNAPQEVFSCQLLRAISVRVDKTRMKVSGGAGSARELAWRRRRPSN